MTPRAGQQLLEQEAARKAAAREAQGAEGGTGGGGGSDSPPALDAPSEEARTRLRVFRQQMAEFRCVAQRGGLAEAWLLHLFCYSCAAAPLCRSKRATLCRSMHARLCHSMHAPLRRSMHAHLLLQKGCLASTPCLPQPKVWGAQPAGAAVQDARGEPQLLQCADGAAQGGWHHHG